MAKLQGSGKVRLIAKNGRHMETAHTQSVRAGLQTARSRGAKGAADASLMADELKYGTGVGDYFVEFDATPDITESGGVEYMEISQVRGPGSIVVYMGSPSRNFTINAKLIARTAREAFKVSSQIHLLKSWRQPESYVGGFNVGPPTLLYLQGYGKMFKDIPVVMTDLSIEFSSEHDYILAATHNKAMGEDGKLSETEKVEIRGEGRTIVPIIVPVSISLKEARATDENLNGLDSFDILKYRTGDLFEW